MNRPARLRDVIREGLTLLGQAIAILVVVFCAGAVVGTFVLGCTMVSGVGR